MIWQKLDLNLIRVLAMVLEEGSIVRAAARLHISPSAVSHALRRLRRSFGDPLFVRVGQRMVPTPRAESLRRAITDFRADLEASLARGSRPGAEFDPSASSRMLRIAAPGALELTLVPALAAALRRQAPGWRLEIRPFERRSYEPELVGGEIDFVLEIGGHTPAGELVAREELWEDEMVALAGPRCAVPAGTDEIETTAFMALPQLYPLPWPIGQNYLDVALARAGQHRQLFASLPGYAAVGPMIEQTDLVAAMPDRTALAIAARHPELRILRVSPRRRSPLLLLHAASRQADLEQRWARGLISRAAASAPRPICVLPA